MREVTVEEYLEFVSKRREIKIEDQVIRLEPINVSRLVPSDDELTDVSTTVWSFPKRGSWATHKGDYRGNWAPQIPRALILMYTKPGDTVLDPMVGSGTTCIEAKLLGRNCVGVDINYDAVMLTMHRLYWLERALDRYGDKYLKALAAQLSDKHHEISLDDVRKAWYKIYHGDARNLDKIDDESIDLIAIHPPYWGIIKYAGPPTPGDLSRVRSLEEYIKLMGEVARELYRVLKPGGFCGVLIGDTRIRKHYVPISHYVLEVFLKTGFILKEEVIKIQHKMKTTREVWRRLRSRDFLLIYHEKLYVFRKPSRRERLSLYKYSRYMEIG